MERINDSRRGLTFDWFINSDALTRGPYVNVDV